MKQTCPTANGNVNVNEVSKLKFINVHNVSICRICICQTTTHVNAEPTTNKPHDTIFYIPVTIPVINE